MFDVEEVGGRRWETSVEELDERFGKLRQGMKWFIA